MDAPDDMVVMPAGMFGHQLLADGTSAWLSSPQLQQLRFPFELIPNLEVQAFFEVRFPVGIIRISVGLDFDVTPDRNLLGVEEPDGDLLTLWVVDLTAEDLLTRTE